MPPGESKERGSRPGERLSGKAKVDDRFERQLPIFLRECTRMT